jgi:hypothetical protein
MIPRIRTTSQFTLVSRALYRLKIFFNDDKDSAGVGAAAAGWPAHRQLTGGQRFDAFPLLKNNVDRSSLLSTAPGPMGLVEFLFYFKAVKRGQMQLSHLCKSNLEFAKRKPYRVEVHYLQGIGS